MDNDTTYLCTADETSITIRGKDLVSELVGHLTYTEMVFFLLRGRVPTPAETRVLDACLVVLMEHGLTLNTLTARFVASAVPDQMQVAMGASLMTIGDTFMGTMEGCARILQTGVREGGDARAYCAGVVAKFRGEKKAVPGFGHRFHKPDDPRSPRLFAIAEEAGAAGPHIAMLRILAEEVDRAAGRHLTINATGAIGALFSDIGFGPEVMRGLAVVSRSGGLVAHIAEERQSGSARLIEKLAKQAVQYRDPPAG
ncbi:citryl-CoA lyase [Roseomonas sp. HJA6]|uniref:citrate synthase (unknown stereospecificity) n=1 Tax=Roseomonas alba TaxID=2846776 RepID=A0ABS7ADY5_9PROT|nr:citryl-CoA lyase [Neoroseomonas alba]MBW6400512.1 citryl-CoA lyase [Neoroseomonas alba]